jgi:hypothetical protein
LASLQDYGQLAPVESQRSAATDPIRLIQKELPITEGSLCILINRHDVARPVEMTSFGFGPKKN